MNTTISTWIGFSTHPHPEHESSSPTMALSHLILAKSARGRHLLCHTDNQMWIPKMWGGGTGWSALHCCGWEAVDFSWSHLPEYCCIEIATSPSKFEGSWKSFIYSFIYWVIPMIASKLRKRQNDKSLIAGIRESVCFFVCLWAKKRNKYSGALHFSLVMLPIMWDGKEEMVSSESFWKSVSEDPEDVWL